MKKLYGVTTAMTTPFTAEGAVDLDSVAAMTEVLIGKGIHCLYPLGTTGEFLRMSVAERKAVAKTVIDTAAGRVPVFIHVGAMYQEDAIELAQHAEQIGADGIGAVTPQFFKCTDNELVEFYAALANSVSKDFPVYLYNIPQNAGNDLTADTARRIAERCENVVGIKYSVQDMKRTLEYLSIAPGRFSVMHGTDRLLAAVMTIGCDGVISGTSSMFPEPYLALYNAYQAGDTEGVRKWTLACSSLGTATKNGTSLSHYKAAISWRGLNGGYTRKPLLPLDSAAHSEMVAMLEKFCDTYGISRTV